MKQVTNEEFSKIMENDEALAKKLLDYVKDVNSPEELQKKTMEFAKKEGYEITLSADELANVSGGSIDINDAKRVAGKLFGWLDKNVGSVAKREATKGYNAVMKQIRGTANQWASLPNSQKNR